MKKNCIIPICFTTGIDFQELISDLSNGIRLPNPLLCPPPITSLLEKCFDETPDKRPDFKTIKHYLEVIYPNLDSHPQANGFTMKKIENVEMKTRYAIILQENKSYHEMKVLQRNE